MKPEEREALIAQLFEMLSCAPTGKWVEVSFRFLRTKDNSVAIDRPAVEVVEP